VFSGALASYVLCVCLDKTARGRQDACLATLNRQRNTKPVPKRRDRSVITPSYSRGPRFDSQPLRPAILIEIFHDLPQFLQTNARILP
jgi:hypothetical protein